MNRSVLVAAHQLYSVRYLLDTDIVPRLREMGIPVAILSPNAEDPEFRSRFARDGVAIERFRYEAVERRLGSRLGQLFVRARWLALPDKQDIATLLLHEEVERRDRPNRALSARLNLDLTIAVARLLRKSARARQGFRALERTYLMSNAHRAVFERHRPSLLVVPDVGTIHLSNPLVWEAQRRGVRVVSVVLSWDNPTSKGMGAISPDYAIAWNGTMKDELVAYHDIPPARVEIGGVAHFDPYFRSPPRVSHPEFLRGLGLSPERRTILFGAASPSTFWHNPDVMRALLEAIKAGALGDAQLLVRIHPASIAKLTSDTGGEREAIERLKHTYGDRLGLHWPPAVKQQHGALLPIDDQDNLAAMLTHCDVLVSVFSTLMLEAAIHDLPAVNVALYNYRDTDISNRVLETFPHIRKMLRHGASRTAYTEPQLVELVGRYLGDRTLDREGRRQACEAEAGPNKGRAGAAIAEIIGELWLDAQRGDR